jgi:DNA-binding response OmpR family regulator
LIGFDMAKLLLADDDVALCDNLSGLLSREGHSVDVANDGEDTLEFLRLYQYDALILDWDMPECSGLRVCQIHRTNNGTTPILMLTGKAAVDAKVEALDAGADDYLTKPFDVKELHARLRALLRRPQALQAQKLIARHVEIDLVTGKVFSEGKEVHCQPLEFALLEFFLRNTGRVFTAEQILNRVWDAETSVSTEALYTCMRRIRRKFDKDCDEPLIRNIHGRGYILEVP